MSGTTNDLLPQYDSENKMLEQTAKTLESIAADADFNTTARSDLDNEAQSYLRKAADAFNKNHYLGKIGLFFFHGKVGPQMSNLTPNFYEYSERGVLKNDKTFECIASDALGFGQGNDVNIFDFKIIKYKHLNSSIASLSFNVPNSIARGGHSQYSLFFELDRAALARFNPTDFMDDLEQISTCLAKGYISILEKYHDRENFFIMQEEERRKLMEERFKTEEVQTAAPLIYAYRGQASN